MTIRSNLRALVAGLAAIAVALPLAACGSSGDDAGSATTAARTAAGGGGPGGRDRAELTACLREQGVELPQPPAGGGRPDGPPQGATTPDGPPGTDGGPGAGGGFFGRDLSEAERAKLEAAFEACSGRGGAPGRAAGAGPASPSAAALEKFVACVRRNGYDLPEANTSGDGPVFDEDAVDREDPAFVSATRACQRYLAPAG
ncbi:MAG TPA: hypothetical protein VLK58_20645 [Conexibacter sp.]|nr:hypothetical protein [Conexibacter sp.]